MRWRLRAEFRYAPLQDAALGAGVREPERAVVLRARLTATV
jgi:hypothetical protein